VEIEAAVGIAGEPLKGETNSPTGRSERRTGLPTL